MKKLLLLGIVLLFITNIGIGQHSISGYTVSLEKAGSVPNATIFLNDKYGLSLEESLRITSDSTGFYKITGIKEGTYIINAWTMYEAMNQRYAQVIQSERIKIDSNLTVDFVFSEASFKYSLHFKHHPLQAFDGQVERPDNVVRQAVSPQLFINSRPDTVGACFIEKISDFKER